MKTKYLVASLALSLGLLLLLLKLLAAPSPLRSAAGVHYVAPGGETRVAEGTYTVVSASATLTPMAYLPLVSCPPDPCRPISGASYSSLSVVNPTNPDPETNPDYNLALLGYDLTDAYKGLVYYGPGDTNAPQFYYFFGDRRLPVFSNVYRVHGWDWEQMVPLPPPPMPWPVTAVGFEVAAGDEIIHAPDSGYDIGEGYDALVLYASQTQITLKYTREDDIIDGYTVYVDGICVEPSLLALYEQLDASGRQNLPAVQGGQPLGRARNAEIVVSIRDKACPMDPRARDWWRRP